MKKIIILLVALVWMAGANAQWLPQNSGTTNNLNSVYFTDINTGWAVGDSGTILNTSNGGLNWLTQSSDSTINLNSVFFTDNNHGYAVGKRLSGVSDGLKTTDGGTTWIHTNYWNSSYSYELKSVQFTDASTGYIFGYQFGGWGSGNTMFILKTLDSGANWNQKWSLEGMCIEGCVLGSMFFSGPDSGYIIHTEKAFNESHAIIYKTTDGWTTWDEHEIVFYVGMSWGGLSVVSFPDANNGYAIGYGLFKSIDGGITWTELNGYGNSFFFINPNEGWVIRDAGTILHSTNGGTDWETQNSSTTMDLTSVHFIDENTGYAVGDNGTIVKTTNGGVVGLNDSSISSKFLKLYPNPANDKIAISSPAITGITKLSILNVSGEKVLEMQLTETETQLDIKALPRGVYFVRLQNEKMVEVGKMVKE